MKVQKTKKKKTCKHNKEHSSKRELIPLPPGKKPVSWRQMYAIKVGPNGEFDHLKARLLAKEYTQIYGPNGESYWLQMAVCYQSWSKWRSQLSQSYTPNLQSKRGKLMVANGCMLSKLVEMEKSIVSNLDWWPKCIPYPNLWS